MPTYINKCIIFIKFAEFSVLLPCSGNNSGIAQLGIGLMIESRKGKPLNGTPLRLNLRKECAVRGECVNRAHDHLFLYTHTHACPHAQSSVSAIIHCSTCYTLQLETIEISTVSLP